MVLKLGPGLGVSVTELLQDQLLGKGPGHSKPVEGQKSFTIALKIPKNGRKWKKIKLFNDGFHCVQFSNTFFILK